MAFNGSISSIGIGLAVYLDDHFTRTSGVVKASMEGLGFEAKTLGQHLNNLNNFGSGLEAVGRGMVGIAKRGVEAFASYDHIMNSVKVIAQVPKDQAKQMREELDDLNSGLAVRYGVLPDAIAKAQLELSKAGKKGQEIKNMTEAVVALGAATDTQVDGANGTAEVLVNVMQAYGAASNEAHKYAAVLTSAANQSTIDVKDFYQSMRYTADVATMLGVSIEETAAVMATLGNAGLKGSNAGTTYANMLRYLSTALSEFKTQRQSASLKKLGLNEKDFITEAGELKDMSEILQNLRKSMLQMSKHEQFLVTQGLFQVRGSRALPLIKSLVENQEGIFSFEDNLAKIISDRDNNAHQQQAIDRQDSLQGDLNRLASAWQVMWIKMGESLSPMLRNIIPRLTSAIEKATAFLDHPIMGRALMAMSSTGVIAIIAGKLIQGVAGFGMFLVNFNANFQGMIAMYNSIQKGHSLALKTAGSEMLASARMMITAASNNLLASRGMLVRGAAGGGTLIQGRTQGKFTKGIKSNWFVRLAGMIGGFKWAKGAARLSMWFLRMGAAVAKALPWIVKLGSGLKWLGRFLLRWGGRLLGIWGFLADMAVTMITGKSILEWGWDILSSIFSQAGELYDVISTAIKAIVGWTMNIATFGIAGLITDGKWGGRIGGDVKSWFEGSSNNKGVTDEDLAWWEKSKQLMSTGGTPPPEKPLFFQGGELVDQDSAMLVKPNQIDPVKTTVSKETKVIEKQKHTLNLTINAPASGSFQQQVNLDDDRALLGQAVI